METPQEKLIRIIFGGFTEEEFEQFKKEKQRRLNEWLKEYQHLFESKEQAIIYYEGCEDWYK